MLVTQRHLDRLSALDASFVAHENETSHMHIGGLVICDGPPPDFDRLLDHVRSRLHLVPRYRHRLVQPPLEAGRWVWADAPAFDVEYHVRRTALPPGAGHDALLRTVGRIVSQQLDRRKPLWEMWVIEGLPEGRFAIVSKSHHALTDGIAGVDLATVMFDLTPEPAQYPHPDQPWYPARTPSSSELLVGGAAGLARTAVGAATSLAVAAAAPAQALRTAKTIVGGAGELIRARIDGAPSLPFNRPIGPHRRFHTVRAGLDEVKLVKNTFGGTVNDVVLALVTAGLRDWLQHRGIETDGLKPRAMVPVSTRRSDQRGQTGNRIVAMRAPLPVSLERPLDRLRTVCEAMGYLKRSQQKVAASTLVSMQGFAPPTVLAQASRLNFSTRLFNLIVTNVPGPQVPVYAVGQMMREVYPIAFLPRNHGLAIGIMSYMGQLNFGLLADYDLVPDIAVIGDGIRHELNALTAQAAEVQTGELSTGA